MTPFTLRALLLSTALVATPALAHDRSEEPHDPLLRVSQDAVALIASGDTSGDEPGAALQRAAATRTLGIALLREGRAREARDAFELTLARAPHDAMARWGLWRAQILIDGEGPRVDAARDAFRRAWPGGAPPRLEQL
jgi:Flp pilus assembly protein TadD